MIWKVSSVYKTTKRSKQNNYPAARRHKPNSAFDELFSTALSLPADAAANKKR
jgi:hypothetical protein